AMTGLAHAALTPVNASGNSNGAERCMAGVTCPGGAYAGAVSIVRAFEIDNGLAAGSLQRVDDALDQRWMTLGAQAAIRPLARYAADDSQLGVWSGAGVATLTPALQNTRVWLDHPSLLAGDPRASDFRQNGFAWTAIPAAASFQFVLLNQ